MRTLRAAVLGLLLCTPSLAAAGDLAFDPVPVPRSPEAKKVVQATRGAVLDGRRIAIGFSPLLATGTRYGTGLFGQAHTLEGRPVLDGQGRPVVSRYADFTSLMPRGGQLLAVTHFESLPSSLYLSRLRQNRTTGAITAVATRDLRLAGIGGIYNPCAGVVTAWGTHLGGEEYPPDVRAFEAALAAGDAAGLGRWVPQAMRYFSINPQAPDLAAVRARFKPYRYGYPFEVRAKGWLNVSVVRHHAMGRFSHEVATVMPDRRTVYMTDDDTNTGLFLFVADRAGDLSAGRLFAARLAQTVPAGSRQFEADVSWIDLGHATSRDISRAIERGTTFADLFETAPMTAQGTCPTGFSAINMLGDGAQEAGECLKLKPGQERLASRLETRRYAALKGATTELAKTEGLAFDPVRKQLFLSITAFDRGMGDNAARGQPTPRFDRGGPNHIRVAYNPCGAVATLDLARDASVGSDFTARRLTTLLAGRPDPKVAADSLDKCALDGIANPDNLTYIPEHDTLIIAEDSDDGHENDAIWAYDIARKRLTRIMTVPQGGEASGVYWHRGINGFDYLTAVVQHPFGDGVEKRGIKPPSDDPRHRAAVVGVIGPFPTPRR